MKRVAKTFWQVLRVAIKRPSGVLTALVHLPKAPRAQTAAAHLDACTFWQQEPCEATLCDFGHVGMRMAQPRQLGLVTGKLAFTGHTTMKTFMRYLHFFTQDITPRKRLAEAQA